MNRLLLIMVSLVTIGVVVLGILWFVSERDDEPGPNPSAASRVSRFAVAAEEVTEKGASVDVTVVARMPQQLGDAVSRRRFEGSGTVAETAAAAAAEFEMSSIPNSAGYFGHVSGEMSVLYSQSVFLVTFPIMVEALENEVEWMRYDLATLSEPTVMELGIGQLREVGLADPRLGLALLQIPSASVAPAPVVPAPTASAMATPAPANTSPAPATVSPGESSPPATTFPDASSDVTEVVRVIPAQAAREAPAHLRTLLNDIAALGVQRVDLTPSLDSDGDLTSYGYTLAYPAGRGGGSIKLRVTVDLVNLGGGDPVEIPPEAEIRSYRDQLGI